MSSIFILSFYYWVITFSIIGFGLIFNRLFLKSSEIDIGFIGVYGIFFLTFIAYITSFFLPHTELFNSFLILIGLIFFLIKRNQNIIKKNIKNILFIFIILNIFIFVSKNHDDFSYYHFPYTHLLTEHSNMIGLGNFNHGFRTHSSIFYLSSLFNLPFSNYFLLHISPVFFIGFANIIFYNKILLFLNLKQKLSIVYLSLLSLIFVNIFFYRLSEHGTDRSAMILIIVTIIELLYLINLNTNINKNLFLKLLILITLIISLKTFYILYVLMLLPVIIFFKEKRLSLVFFFKNIITYICLTTFFALLTVNFFNTGCLLYPVKFLCFESFSWSIPLGEVEQMNNWYQQWAKAGANPNYRVDNPENYIKNFNWVSNWIDKYFFNKVSDFLLGLSFLSLFVFLTFFSKKKQQSGNFTFWTVYIILIFLTVQWFYFLPTLRYGGYHLIALLVFIPLSVYLSKYSISKSLFKKKIYFMIFLTIVIFLGRNTSRLINEYEIYNYNIFKNAHFKPTEKNFKIFNRIQNINKCNIQNDLKICLNENIKVKFLNNTYIYYRD
jgi:hypothetical protein